MIDFGSYEIEYRLIILCIYIQKMKKSSYAPGFTVREGILNITISFLPGMRQGRRITGCGVLLLDHRYEIGYKKICFSD